MPEINRNISFNVGIEGIMSGASEVGRQNLPDLTRVLPGGTEEAGAVYGALLRNTLNDEIKALLEPDIENREVMMPEVFTAALEKALSKTRAKAAETGSEVLQNLAKTLEEVQGNKELCEMFRNLLLPG